ncbi:MAG: hypothetical protein RLO81_18245 [Fulvivirga sp.]|uniref:hypothetical protein n=1 Tax=Fulvivirga sp. TaxID=1931237 RepID=UPI0032EE9153
MKPEVKINAHKLKSTTKIPKLNNILEEARIEDEEKKANTTDEDELYGEDKFTEEELLTTWNDFAEKAKAEGRDSEYAVLKQNVRLENEHTIIITFTNSVKLVILDKFRSDLITYLKTKLNNRHIKLETELKEEEQSKVPYTNGEKFEFMSEKKPILKELKNRLGLDPDF